MNPQMQRAALIAAATLPLFTLACGSQEQEEEVATTQGALTQITGPVIIKPPIQICGLHLISHIAPSFEFDGGNEQGWTLNGIYNENQSVPNPQPTVVSGPAGWYGGTNYPGLDQTDPTDGRGSAYFFSSPTFGTVDHNNQFWFEDFVSPTLGESWQTYRNFRYAVMDQMPGALPVGRVTTAQLILKVQKCDGTISYFAEKSGANYVFCPMHVDGTWTDCQTSVTLPSGIDKILNIIVRVFVPAGGLYEGPVFLDHVRAF